MNYINEIILILLHILLIICNLNATIITATTTTKATYYEKQWQKFTINFHRNYSLPREDPIRQNIFKNNIKLITEHNKKFQNGKISYDLSINHFSDLTTLEYYDKYLQSYEKIEKNLQNLKNFIEKLTIRKIIERKTKIYQILPRTDLSDTINWLKYGYKNKIVNQMENCKNSYVLASLSTMEAHYFLKYQKLIQLSDQNVLKCSRRLGNFGCMGGSIERIYQYGMLYGISTKSKSKSQSKSMNYNQTSIITCKNERKNFSIQKIYISSSSKLLSSNITTSATTTSAKSSSSKTRTATTTRTTRTTKKPTIELLNVNKTDTNNELAMQQAIAFYGPVTAAIDARLDTFRFYRGGLYYDTNCSSTLNETNHFVTVIGYGKMIDNNSNNDNDDDDNKEYWLIRNSFGTDWGVNGYMFLAKNKNNHCGIGTYFIYPEIS